MARTRRPDDPGKGRQCRLCLWYVPKNAQGGQCHRYPQEVKKEPADWCGEYVEDSRKP